MWNYFKRCDSGVFVRGYYAFIKCESQKGSIINNIDLKHIVRYLKKDTWKLVMLGLGKLYKEKLCYPPHILVVLLVGHPLHSAGMLVDMHLK